MNNGELKTLNGMHVQLKKTEQEPPQTPEGCGRMVAAEYWAYRYFCAGIAAAEQFEHFRKRTKEKLPKAWSLYKCGMGMIDKAREMLYLSFTPEERGKIKREMNRDMVKLIPTGPVQPNFEELDALYLSRETVMWLVSAVVEKECTFCDKCGDKAKRCPVKKKLDGIFAHRIPTDSRGSCIWSEYGNANGREQWNDMMRQEWSPDDDEEIIGERHELNKPE